MISFLKLVFVIISGFFLSLLSVLLTPLNFKGVMDHFCSDKFAAIILWISRVKLDITGLEKLNKNDVYIFVSNHQSYYDIPIIMRSIPNRYKFIYKKSLNWVPVFGWSMFLAKYISIDRNNARKALESLKRAAGKIQNGFSVVIFPEGTRSKDGNIGSFKKGIFYLAEEAKEKIVPITLIGTYNILPKNSFKINGGKVKVIIGEPVKFKKDKYFMNEIREIIVNNFEKNNF